MKKAILLIAITLITFSCKNTEEKKDIKTIESEIVKVTNNTDKIYKGDFVYLADAAVLKGDNFIYGVKINEKMHELADKVSPVKESDFDMVPVAVKGYTNPKPAGEEGWDEIITITEIIMVGKKPSKVDIKLDNN